MQLALRCSVEASCVCQTLPKGRTHLVSPAMAAAAAIAGHFVDVREWH
jgi:hypothetical protein